MTDLHEPLEPLESYPDELPPPRQRGDVNLVGLLSVADDLASSLAAPDRAVPAAGPSTNPSSGCPSWASTSSTWAPAARTSGATRRTPRSNCPDDIFSSFITGRGLFWARTDKVLLSILPQKHAVGYNIGYSGGGPHALVAYLTQIARNDGGATPAGTPYEDAHPAIVAWSQSTAADRGTNELTLSDLQAMLES
ncbi:hypothetical protein ACWGPD_25255 [Streptomyces hirsutus]|uniref:hypothetical protein n=1 Tax=Streptomyces hirsutus TaxID=35620 RepID=UPI00363EA0ED